MRQIAWLVAAAGLGCSNPAPGAGVCNSNAECPGGQVCAGTCRKVCIGDVGCGAGQICVDGLCAEGTRHNAPQIISLDGSGSPTPAVTQQSGVSTGHRLRDRLVVTGVNLLGSVASLTRGSEPALELAILSASDNELVARLPEGLDTAPGNYLLTLMNAAGTAQAEVWLLQGEPGPAGPNLTDAELLARLTNVDGSASGLDADSIDGLDGASLAGRLQALETALLAAETKLTSLQAALPGQPNLFFNSTFTAQSSPAPAFPDGWVAYVAGGSATITAVAEHPFTKAFIGPYTDVAPASTTSAPDAATDVLPYWYGSYNCGPRIGRWGWGTLGFKLLHLTISGDAASAVVYSDNVASLIVGNERGQYHFRGYVKILRGTAFGVSQDVGASSLTVTKTVCDQSPQGWCLLDGSFGGAKTSGAYLSFGRPSGNLDDLEVYVALPYLTVEDPLWRDR